MPSRVWSHICDYATMDASQKASIVGEFDVIFGRTVPVRHPFFFVVSKWNGYDKEQFTLEVRVTSPSRRIIANSGDANITIVGGANGEGYYIAINAFLMIEFREFGEHSIEFVLNGNAVHFLPLTIAQTPQNPA